MEAFILAAGLGTRLRPLTNDRPKALVEIDGRTLLEINIDRIVKAGARRIIINIHHFADKMVDFITSRDWGTEVIISDESGLLLDTGGGLKNAQSFFSMKEPILIHNVDILHHLDLSEIISQHTDSMNIATLIVSQRSTSRYLLFNQDNLLTGWHNKKTDQTLWVTTAENQYRELAFSGLAVIQPELLNLLPEAQQPYPIVPEYLKIARNHRISIFEHPADQWMDVGKPETLAQASQFLKKK